MCAMGPFWFPGFVFVVVSRRARNTADELMSIMSRIQTQHIHKHTYKNTFSSACSVSPFFWLGGGGTHKNLHANAVCAPSVVHAETTKSVCRPQTRRSVVVVNVVRVFRWQSPPRSCGGCVYCVPSTQYYCSDDVVRRWQANANPVTTGSIECRHATDTHARVFVDVTTERHKTELENQQHGPRIRECCVDLTASAGC